MTGRNVSQILQVAVIAYSTHTLHPFEDGNKEGNYISIGHQYCIPQLTFSVLFVVFPHL